MSHDAPLTPDQLFDLTHTGHAELFDEAQYGWEAIPLIAEYLEYRAGDATIEGEVDEGAVVEGGVSIGAGTTVESGAIIKGPAIIGKNCEIRSGAYIRGNVIIGDNCIIGNSTEVKNALLFDEVMAPHFNYIGDSIVGYKAHLGSGVVLSNLKTPPSEIVVRTLDAEYPTGLEKFGALLGDRTEVGANAVLNPGTIIGRDSLVYPQALVRGVVPSQSILKVRQEQQVTIKRI